MTNIRDYYGPVQAEIDRANRVVTLTRKQAGPESLRFTDGVIQKCVSWASSVMAADYPDFEIVDLTHGE